MAFEVLRKEVETLDGNGEKFISEERWRLLINPEFVESMDNSDGSEKFSPEDQAIECFYWLLEQNNRRLKTIIDFSFLIKTYM